MIAPSKSRTLLDPSVKMHRQLARHRHLCNLPSPSHREVKEPAAPLRLAAQQHVPVLADVAHSAAIAA